jgi:hypothetical protein
MANIRIEKAIVIKILISAKRFSSSRAIKKSLANLGYLNKYTFLQKLVTNIATLPITLSARSTVTVNSSTSSNVSPDIIFPSF